MSLRIYEAFQQRYSPKTLKGKIMLVAFIGIHIPLLGLVGYITFSQSSFYTNIHFLMLTLISTLVGMSATLWIISGLLKPVGYTTQFVEKYLEGKELPSLPTKHTDEAGVLMASTQRCIEELDQLLSMKDDLISMISHDARSPISSILMALELIEKDLQQIDTSNTQIKEHITIIEKSANQQKVIINDLLTTATLGTKSFTIQKDSVNIPQMFDEIKDIHRVQAKDNNISLKTDLSLLRTETAVFDSAKIKSVLNNLIGNALKFTPENGTISVRAKESDSHFEFSIRDNGIGIEETDIENIFDRNYTTRPPNSKVSGTGLGLWICQEFVELHEGTISVESTPQEGTTFKVYLPRN